MKRIPTQELSTAQARLLLAQRGLAVEMKQAAEKMLESPRGDLLNHARICINFALEMQTLNNEIQHIGNQLMAAQLAANEAMQAANSAEAEVPSGNGAAE